MVEFLVELSEFDARKLYLALGYRSLFEYLTRALTLSESSAFYRKTAAELIRRFPSVLECLRDGRLCITNLVKLRDVLTLENHATIIGQAIGRPKRDIETLV